MPFTDYNFCSQFYVNENKQTLIFYLNIFTKETPMENCGLNVASFVHLKSCWSANRLRPDHFGIHKMFPVSKFWMDHIVQCIVWTMSTPPYVCT